MSEPVLLCVDMGTTRTRAWLTLGAKILASNAAAFGVRDVASGKTREWLLAELTNVLQTVQETALASNPGLVPEAVVAAGMITSAEGLYDIPHRTAPVSVLELADNMHREELTLCGCPQLPFLLVPGVRTATGASSFESILETDVMRGEETLAVGLVELGTLTPGSALLNLGSHWKWIWTDSASRIARSRTSLTGEMIHAVQAHTLIASALPQHPPESLDQRWLDRGFAEAYRSGLSRALFCVRLLAQQEEGTPQDHLAFVYGAFLESDLRALSRPGFEGIRHVVLAGMPPIANAWQRYLQQDGIASIVLSESQREHAYLHGLLALYRRVRPS